MDNREIKIRRNIIEKSLMAIKDFIRRNKKATLYALSVLIVLVILIISSMIYYNYEEKMELSEFEQIIDSFRHLSISDKKEKIKKLQETVNRLNELISSSYWGYVNENGYYEIASLYMSEKIYKDGKDYYLKFAEKSPSSFFVPFALRQAGIASEHLGDFDGAFRIYQRFEQEYSNSVIADEVCYDLGRMYQKKENIFKAREYYNKLISQYPLSIFANKAKNRLFLLGYLEKDKSTN